MKVIILAGGMGARIREGSADLFAQIANETEWLRVNVLEKLMGHKR